MLITTRLDSERMDLLHRHYKGARPFDHMVLDSFFETALAQTLSNEFIDPAAEGWWSYDNPIEIKKTFNSWERFPATTYQTLFHLNSSGFIRKLEELSGISPLYPDIGLNGGGWHLHGRNGKLNVHLDYSIHPKLRLQRRLNLIVYLTSDWSPQWGGGLGLWTHDASRNRPLALEKTVDCLFNRAVLFDTTQNSWHGLPDPIDCPLGKFRKSLAVYYLTDPPAGVDTRGKAMFAPYQEQEKDPEILELIKRRSEVPAAAETYRRKARDQ